MLCTLATTTSVIAHAGSAVAEEPARLRPIVVIGASDDTFESEADTTGFTQVIHTREAWRGYETVGEVLEHAVGVQVRHFGAREDFATISVRGSTPNQVKILLDGVSLSRAQSDVVNVADIPMDAVERIEVYRGFTPVRFASSGAASVINIVTRADAAGEYGMSLTYGSFDTAKLSLHAGERLGPGTLSGFLTYRHTDGDFVFEDDTPDPVSNPAGERTTRTRINNELDSLDMLLRYRVPLPVGRLEISGNGYYKEEGTPGPAADQQALASYEAARSILAASLQTDGGTTLSADFTYLDETVRDPKDPGSDRPGFGRPPRADNTTIAASGGATTAHAIGDHHFLEGGVEAAYEAFDGRFSDSGSGQDELPSRDQRRTRLALALGDEIYVPMIRLVLSPQLRYESVWNDFDGESEFPPVSDDLLPDDRESSLDPRFGARLELASALTLKGNIGTYFRPPSFGELFGDDGFSSANPALNAEEGVNRDIGFLWSRARTGAFERIGLEYAYFNNDVEDMILFITSGNRIPRPQNVGKARVRGHEVRLEAAGPGGVSVESNYTHQDAENRTPFPEFRGKELPSLPRDELYSRMTIDRGPWSLTYELEYRSSVFLDQANLLADERVPAHTIHGITLEMRPFRSDVRFAFEASNLGDRQISDVVGFPAPGRAFFLTVSYVGRRNVDDGD